MSENITIEIDKFIPPYLKEFELYKHLESALDIAINKDLVSFSAIEKLNSLILTFFGKTVSSDQKESILFYYKIFIEPYIGTPVAIKRLFNILNLDSKVITWFQNRVPLPPYKFSIEFSTTPSNLGVKSLIGLINLVKNERSHLFSVRNPNSPDVAVWDYSSWDVDCWDNPAGITIDGVVYNLVKEIDLYYDTKFNLIQYKDIITNYFQEERFKTNKSLNSNLETNFDDDKWSEPKFTVQDFEKIGISTSFDSRILGDFTSEYLESSSSYNKISLAKQLDLNYPDHVKIHINPYSKIDKNSIQEIIRIKNKTINSFYLESSKRVLLDKTTRYKNDSTFNLKDSYLSTPNLSPMLSDFSIFAVIKINDLQVALKSILKTTSNSFNVEISSVTIKLTKDASSLFYANTQVNDSWTYLYLDSSYIRIGSFIESHNLSLTLTDSLIFGSNNLDLNFTNLMVFNRPLISSELSKLISSYV